MRKEEGSQNRARCVFLSFRENRKGTVGFLLFDRSRKDDHEPRVTIIRQSLGVLKQSISGSYILSNSERMKEFTVGFYETI